MSRRGAEALLCVAILSAPAHARELWSHGEASLEVSGSVRELAVVTGGTDRGDFQAAIAARPAQCVPAAAFPNCPAFDLVGNERVATSLTRLRTRVDLRFTENLFAVAEYDHELRAGVLDTLGSSLGDSIRGDSLLRAEGDIVDSAHVDWRHALYRGYLAFESERLDLAVGRQRIPWGVGRLWQPIDRFNAIPPLALEPDLSRGVDSVDARWRFSGFTYLEAVFAPLRDFDDSSYALRLHGIAFDIDYSAMVGVFEEALTAGFDLAGNVAGAAARVEVVYTDPDRHVRPVGSPRSFELPTFWQVVGSVDYLFDLGSGVYVLVEHLYNGNALGFGRGEAGTLLPFFEEVGPAAAATVVPTSADRFGGSRVVTFAENQTGLQLGYDLTPEIRAELVSIWDWDGDSVSFFPSFRYNATDWLELTIGAQFFTGPRLSQYGDAEQLGFVLAEFFF